MGIAKYLKLGAVQKTDNDCLATKTIKISQKFFTWKLKGKGKFPINSDVRNRDLPFFSVLWKRLLVSAKFSLPTPKEI